MHHSRTYSYDESPSSYSGGGTPAPDGTQFPESSPTYHRNYNQHPGSGQYYAQNPGQANDGSQPSPYYRSMTPMSPPAHRYTSSGDQRYYQSPGGSASSSHASQSPYPAQQTPYHPSQYRSRQSGSHSHSPDAHFIPTPSEMAHSYNNNYPRQISVPPQSPTMSAATPYSPSRYPAPHTIVPSSQRPARISTGSRPQTAPTGASPTSASSPSGERFPCERCGKTFSRSHDRKRHHETQHLTSPVIHRCRYCEKEFSRADSLKRHLDNGCDEMPA